MDEDGAVTEAAENAEFRFQTVGEQLKAAREARQFSLTDVAAQTRIPIRHLEALEGSNFAALPGSMYSVGFAKSYARCVGLNQLVIADEMRAELAKGGHAGFIAATPDYEPANPGRVPPRWLAWTAAAIALLGLIGYFAWRSFAFSADAPVVPAVEAEIAPAKAIEGAVIPSAPASGAVVITANEAVWVKIYDADNKRLFESEMKAGESYAVPADSNNPMIVTGRPQALQVTVGGKPVPPLGDPDRTVADVGVSAAALLARRPSSANAPAAVTTGTSKATITQQ